MFTFFLFLCFVFTEKTKFESTEGNLTKKRDILFLEHFFTQMSEHKRQYLKITPEVDQQILDWVEIHGAKDWNMLAILLHIDQRRLQERYKCVLKPTNKQPFTEEERQTLVRLVSEYGQHWSYIRDHFFPDRNDTFIKRQYKSITRSKSQTMKTSRSTPVLKEFGHYQPTPKISIRDILKPPSPQPEKKIEGLPLPDQSIFDQFEPGSDYGRIDAPVLATPDYKDAFTPSPLQF